MLNSRGIYFHFCYCDVCRVVTQQSWSFNGIKQQITTKNSGKYCTNLFEKYTLPCNRRFHFFHSLLGDCAIYKSHNVRGNSSRLMIGTDFINATQTRNISRCIRGALPTKGLEPYLGIRNTLLGFIVCSFHSKCNRLWWHLSILRMLVNQLKCVI